jgi:hypothetical protein
MAPKVSLTIVSNEIVFSITEMGFIKKHLHWKYPTAMGDLIDSTRVLMREVQRLARSDSKLTYTASRYHPNDDARFVVYELLGHEVDGARSLVAIQPLEPQRRGQFRAVAATPFISMDEVAQQLSNSTKDNGLTNHSSPGGLRAPFVIQAILNYLSVVAPHVVVQGFSLAKDPAGGVALSLDLSHTQSISHYVRLSFDFATSKSINESSA